MVDVIGLRFSLQHLRLAGYGLLAVWLSEIVTLLTSPKLAEIGTRLHSISQFLDLSPILLVAICLIAFQGGLRRRPMELALLPLLIALHFFLAPVSVANVITLVQKQQQIGLDQIETIDQQIDRLPKILGERDSIDTLLERPQRIPGLQVRVPVRANVTEARQEVRRSLERERNRIEGNLTASHEAFLRRAGTDATLAVLVGLLLWRLHHGAMREMEQAIPFLDWVLVQGEQQQPEALQELLHFQRACRALGLFSLLERCLRLAGRMVKRPSSEQLAEEEQQRLLPSEPPPNPFATPLRQQVGLTMAASPLPLLGRRLPPLAQTAAAFEIPLDRAEPAEETRFELLSEQMRRRQDDAERREQRRRQRDLDRYRALRKRIEREGHDPIAMFHSGDADPGSPGSESSGSLPGGRAGGLGRPESAALSPRDQKRLERDNRRAREALRRMAQSDPLLRLLADPEQSLDQELREELEQLRALPVPLLPPHRRRGLAGLWHWFLSRL